MWQSCRNFCGSLEQERKQREGRHVGGPLSWGVQGGTRRSVIITEAARRRFDKNQGPPIGVKSVACAARSNCDVRFTPERGHQRSALGCPLCAKSGLMRCSNRPAGQPIPDGKVDRVWGSPFGVRPVQRSRSPMPEVIRGTKGTGKEVQRCTPCNHRQHGS